MSLHLLFDHVAPGQDFHAALITELGGRSGGGTLHTHDFWEMMYVLGGAGIHQLNDRPTPLSVGQLLLVRPKDLHVVQARPGEKLHFINIAFPAPLWRSFCLLVGLETALASWTAALSSPSVVIPATDQKDCGDTFQHALQAFVERPSRFDLCRFWSAALPFFMDDTQKLPDKSASPPWLSRACLAMQSEDNLRLGLPRLVALSGVSPAHLSRTFQACCGQTPTQFVNELRLKRAAILLQTTTHEIIDLAYDCGFNNLSYFYRLFVARYGRTPRSYRQDVRKGIMP